MTNATTTKIENQSQYDILASELVDTILKIAIGEKGELATKEFCDTFSERARHTIHALAQVHGTHRACEQVWTWAAFAAKRNA
tara:strand:- start:349 stop:597 length:249 start_codon:yes stop_codon:yes gene_type:complete